MDVHRCHRNPVTFGIRGRIDALLHGAGYAPTAADIGAAFDHLMAAANTLGLEAMAAIGRRQIASAYHEGRAAGDRVNLNRPVPGDTPVCLT